ncbi:hypothetical protein EGW08_007094 [Elysia chlorotica]|uniref:MYND-type domain-containing protein n=1 Tax=Elysia chlorotica TaxID=188477 RepID=A0A3S1BNT1_ELYCH|nr:hypothetical protein EGW08_007094 [Elysia chlorotica]
MASGRRRKTFKDFYGDLEEENKSDAATTGAGSDSSNRPGDLDLESREEDRSGLESCSLDNSHGSSGADKVGSLGKSSNSFRKNDTAERPKTRLGKGKTQDKPSRGVDIGKPKTSPGEDGATGEAKSPHLGKTNRTHSSSGGAASGGSGGNGPGTTSRDDETFDDQKSGEKDIVSTFEIHTEYQGGPGPRQYRRDIFLAGIKSPIACADGAKVKRDATDLMSKPLTICNLCKTTSPEPLKRCARCCAVSYCSKECQSADFAAHKLFCRRCDHYDIARARVYPAVRFFLDLRHPRDYTVLLEDMPSEYQYQCGAWCNILVEMLGEIPHYRRHSCLVRDLSGHVTKVVFHDETNIYFHPSINPVQFSPRPLGSCLIPGNFLLLVGVHWRHFSDGTLGIRINDLHSAFFIDMSDHALSRLYKDDVKKIVSNYDDSPLFSGFF